MGINIPHAFHAQTVLPDTFQKWENSLEKWVYFQESINVKEINIRLGREIIYFWLWIWYIL